MNTDHRQAFFQQLGRTNTASLENGLSSDMVYLIGILNLQPANEFDFSLEVHYQFISIKSMTLPIAKIGHVKTRGGRSQNIR